MGRAFKPVALVVEDDESQRELVSVLLEESDMRVVACASAEAALAAMEHLGDSIVMIFSDVKLKGKMTGAELASIAKKMLPNVIVVVTSGGKMPALPPDTVFMPKPWRALDVLIMAERSLH
jgi:CheY-like chemotaxis protein